MPTAEHLQDFAAALTPRIAGALRTDAMTRALYATDASNYRMEPAAVLLPRHTDDVQAALEEAARFGLPVTMRGAGSSLAGQTVGAGLIVDCSRYLNALLALDPEAREVRVQPGIVADTLDALLRPHGLMVGPDPASSNRATLGGMVANNATGTHSILYGNVINHIREAGVLLSDGAATRFRALDADTFAAAARQSGLEGQIYAGLAALAARGATAIEAGTPRHWRRNSGYRLEYLVREPQRNLAHLLCGSEGTLAVLTDVTLGLVPRPARTALGVVHYRTRREALLSVTTILETEPSAVELFDGVAITQTRRAPGFAHLLTFLQGDPGAVHITEYYGDTDAELAAKLDALERALNAAGHGYAVVRAITPREISNVWNVRKEGLGLIMSVEGEAKPLPFIEDASVPVEHLADYIDELVAFLDATHTPVAMYAHASAGCLHVRPFINTRDAADVEKMRDIAVASMELVRRFGGAVSSEHGDGLARSWLNAGLLGPELYALNQQVKRLFDPKNLLNPGKIVDAPPMTEDLRMGPGYHTLPVLTTLDFSAVGGFAGLVEQCNGNGACRKLQSGVMCPSYMVTREEEHSTRGRANALRAALSGELPPEAFTSERLYEVLDLCVECKGCKTECPSNVDMARLKMEWLHQYWQQHGVPPRTRAVASMPLVARRMSGLRAAFANRMARQPAFRQALERTLGFSARRTLPPFATEPFTTWVRRNPVRSEGLPVVLFADTFNNYNHPEVSRAALEFLAATGHRVTVVGGHVCCGRPSLSKGLLDDARRHALETVAALAPFAEAGLPIIGLEPSCVLGFRDEYPALLPGDPRVARLAAQAVTFEEFVARRAEEGAFDGAQWRAEAEGAALLLHGHCHQKAIAGMASAERALRLPGYAVTTLDTSCCGMAGSFGYEAEHYDVSVAMAERRLAPAVREATPETVVVAAGTSCRAQIADTTGRAALHPAQVLRDALLAGPTAA